ncbi:hypothetical protein ScalyP_jg993, partial [Parmales sp. scaly parma]
PSPSPNPNLINVNNNTNKSTQALKQLFCGGVAGALAKTLTAPLSRLVILFQVHSLVSSKKSSAPQFATGAISGAQKILTREGAWAFWKGNGTSVLHRFPYSGINFFVYEKALQRLTPAEPALPLTVFCSRFGAGAIAGCSAVIMCYPLDLIRTRLMTDHNRSYRGITDVFRKIIATDGALGLYSGLSATLMVAVPSFAISYGVYGSLKEEALESDRFINFRVIDSRTNKERLGFLVSLGLGAVSGSLSAVITYPVDVIRRRMQIQSLHLNTMSDKTVRQHMRYILKHEGMSGFYRGLSIELMKVVPMVGTMFGTYEFLRMQLELS